MSATPPSIAIAAPVLGGPEVVLARCVEQQQLRLECARARVCEAQ